MDNEYIKPMMKFMDDEIDRLEKLPDEEKTDKVNNKIIMLYQAVEIFHSMAQDRVVDKNAAQRLGVGCRNFYNALADYRNVIDESITNAKDNDSVFFTDNHWTKNEREKLKVRVTTIENIMSL
jgi:hypothetical protein